MGIASLLAGKTFDLKELPLKLATVSRCFRPEIARGKQEGRLYRVHEFTKVEMFVVTADEMKEESEEMFDHLLAIQRKLYGDNGLRLHFRYEDSAPSADQSVSHTYLGRGGKRSESPLEPCTLYLLAMLLAMFG